MKHLLTLITCAAIAVIVFVNVDTKSMDFSNFIPSVEDTVDDSTRHVSEVRNERTAPEEDQMEYCMEDPIEWIDTVMYAKGHSFGYSGDISLWGGWYLDTIFLGDERMLTYDSVAPSKLRLSLVTRVLTVDLGDRDAAAKIKAFLEPIEGFARFRKSYMQCLDSVYDEEYGLIKSMGAFSFVADYPDSSCRNVDVINRFVCHLSDGMEIEKAQVPQLSALYAGYQTLKNYRPGYTGNVSDMSALSDFAAHRTFENWIRGEDFEHIPNDAVLEIKAHVSTPKFATFCKYEYERVGIGHGMYTETFHTVDLGTGKELRNKDIFLPDTHEKVKQRLFEVIANDSHYLEWHGEEVSPNEVEGLILAWGGSIFISEDDESEEQENDHQFILPQGALSDKGVVFSFQPYEIDCWAAGSYHFIVPYKKLMPYLTPKVKNLISSLKSR